MREMEMRIQWELAQMPITLKCGCLNTPPLAFCVINICIRCKKMAKIFSKNISISQRYSQLSKKHRGVQQALRTNVRLSALKLTTALPCTFTTFTYNITII